MFLGTYIWREKLRPGLCGDWTKASEETVDVHCKKCNHAIKL